MDDQFEQFWKLYPKRNGKKVGMYPCELWFEAKQPDPAEFQKMINWLKTDNANRQALDGEFYENLPDPIRFLRNRMWRDDIEPIAPKAKTIKGKFCAKEGCHNPAVRYAGGAYEAYYCKEH